MSSATDSCQGVSATVSFIVGGRNSDNSETRQQCRQDVINPAKLSLGEGAAMGSSNQLSAAATSHVRSCSFACVLGPHPSAAGLDSWRLLLTVQDRCEPKGSEMGGGCALPGILSFSPLLGAGTDAVVGVNRRSESRLTPGRCPNIRVLGR